MYRRWATSLTLANIPQRVDVGRQRLTNISCNFHFNIGHVSTIPSNARIMP